MTVPSAPLCVIPSYLRTPADLDLLVRCLVSLWSTAPEAGVLVVDDGSPERSLLAPLAAAVDELGYELIAKDENEGFSRTVNVGLRRALDTGRDAVLVNADIEFTEAGWLDRMLARTDTQGRPAAVVGARLLYPNGCIQHAGVFLSAPHARVLASLPVRPGDLPEALVPVLLPGDRRAAADPSRDARDGRHLRRGVTGWPTRTSTTACASSQSGRQCIYEPSVCAMHHESVFRGRTTPKIERLAAGSRPSGCAKVGHDRPEPLHPGDRMTDLPRTLFLGISNGAVAWYRCALPATVLGCDWLGVAGEPTEPDDPRRRRRPATSAFADVASYDVVVVQQVAGPAWLQAIRELAGGRRHRPVRDRRLAPRRPQRPGPRPRRAGSTARRVRADELCMRAADGIICSTDYLARRYASLNPRTLDVPQRHRPGPLRASRAPSATTSASAGPAARATPPPPGPGSTRSARSCASAPTRTSSASASRSPTGSSREFGARTLAIPFTALEVYPAAMTHFDIALAPAGQGRLLQGQERPALARGRRTVDAVHRRSGRVPGDRARRHRLPRVDARRDERDPARARRRSRPARPRRRRRPRLRRRAPHARRSPPRAGSRSCARSFREPPLAASS